MEQFDVLIVGGGPAGLAAGLILGRCRRKVLLCDAGKPRNAVSPAMHGFLSRDGLPPHELRRIGRAELDRYGVQIRDLAVLDARRAAGGGFEAHLADGARVASRRIILATGMLDVLPEIEGFYEFYGRGVYPCPYCDAWEFCDGPIAAYGVADEMCKFALMLLRWSRDIIVFHHGPNPPGEETQALFLRHGIKVCEEPIARLVGEGGALARVVLESGEAIPRRALFFKMGERPHSDVAERLGCGTDDAGIVGGASFHGETCVDGVYVVGDASPRVQLAIVAAAEGAAAAVNINKALQLEDLGVE